NSTTPNYSVNHARSGSNSCSASTAPLAHFDLAALGGYSDALIFIAFRGPQVQVNQLRKSSLTPSQPRFRLRELRPLARPPVGQVGHGAARVSGTDYDISNDEKEDAFTSTDATGESSIWLASLNRNSPPRVIARASDEVSFGTTRSTIVERPALDGR